MLQCWRTAPSCSQGANGHLFCLDASTGKIRWHNPLKGMDWNDVSLSIEGKSIHIVGRSKDREESTDDDQS